MLYADVLYLALCLIYDILYDMTLYCTVLYCTVLYCTVLYCTVLYCTVLYCTVLYCTVLYCTVLYCTVLYCTVLYCTVLYCTVLYCTVLYCTVLYCTVLYHIYMLYCILFYSVRLHSCTTSQTDRSIDKLVDVCAYGCAQAAWPPPPHLPFPPADMVYVMIDLRSEEGIFAIALNSWGPYKATISQIDRFGGIPELLRAAQVTNRGQVRGCGLIFPQSQARKRKDQGSASLSGF